MYDSSNRLTSAGGCTYTYNAEDVRIKKVMGESETTYVYDTREKLSKLLVKCTDGVYIKYVYGLGLIGEESITGFKTYHYDYRGSTVAITDAASTVTDTFTYDTYGKLTSRTGTTDTPFMYNGRDGVMTDENGLYYMRARYYHPEIKRFINADIVAGKISNAITLNRFAYADGNPVSNIDPFGLSAERGEIDRIEYINSYMENTENPVYLLLKNWGFSLTEAIHEIDDELFSAFWGGITVKMSVDVTFSTPLDTNVNSDISLSSKNATHEILSPELTLPWDDIGLQTGVYIDEERLSVGTLYSANQDGWTYTNKYQVGLYSEASVTTISYQPDDEYLPTVSLTIDAEMNHLVKIGVALAVVAAIYLPQALVSLAPTAAEFVNQLTTLTPSFAQ